MLVISQAKNHDKNEKPAKVAISYKRLRAMSLGKFTPRSQYF